MASGRIIGFFALLLYILVTLIPDVHSPGLVLTPHFIAFPFVLWWQGGLILMVVLFLLRLYPQERSFYGFGQGIDRWVLSLICVVCLSSLLAEFRPQAIWQAGIFLAFTTIGYGLWQQLKISQNPMGLLKIQALLQLAYILESLILWLVTGVLPQIKHIQNLRNEGVVVNFNLNAIEIHNAMPLGDNNYVAGYVVLALPLFVAFALTEKGLWQKLGILGFVLGLFVIYSTSSFAGFVSLAAMALGFLVLLALRSRLTLGAVVTTLALLAAMGLGNSYIREVLADIFTGNPHPEIAYRSITHSAALAIGVDNWLLGSGVGSVPLVYQKYRPQWALNQAEIDFQLHSIPLQIFSELGIVGIILIVWGAFAIIRYMLPAKGQFPTHRAALIVGIVGYVALAFLDYQLDVVSSSVTVIIYLIVLFYLSDRGESIFPAKYRKISALSGWLLLLAGIVWVWPIDIAWYSSSRGFFHLKEYRNADTIEESDRAFSAFQSDLEQSLSFAPWQPYYSNQLGWNLGSKGWDERTDQKDQNLAVEYFQKAISANPYQEFSYHQMAWLLHNLGNSQAAQPIFGQALSLLPNKTSLNFGLGLNLIRLGKNQLGINSIVAECFYHPLFVTSPMWRSQQLQGIYPLVVAELAKLYQNQRQDLNLAVLNWWLGKPGAVTELRSVNHPATDFLADVIEDKRGKLQRMIDQPQKTREFLISAWYNPNKRKELLRKAWISATQETEVEPAVEALTSRMNTSTSFDEFLRSPLPLFTVLNLKEPRRRIGFGVMSRQVDGPEPYDLFTIEENAILSYFWSDLFPPADRLLSSERNN